MKYFFLMVATFMIMAGCTTSVPAVTQYKLQQNPSRIQQRDVTNRVTLKVLKTSSDTILMNTKMWYSSHNLESNIYHHSQWVLSPTTMVSEALLEHIKTSHLFKDVIGYGSRADSDYVLESHLDEFIQYFSDDMKSSYVIVKLSVTLLQKQPKKLLGTQTFYAKVDVQTLDASGGVKALNEALERVLQKVIIWLGDYDYDK